MSQSLLLLTDLSNAQQGEDEYLAEELSSVFEVKIVCNDNVLDSLSEGDRLIIRNNWPAFGEEEAFWAKLHTVYQGLKELGVRCYNSLLAKGDMQGKVYLNALMNEGFPVIPTVYEMDQLERLGECSRFVRKPCFGGDSWGLEILDAAEIKQKDFSGFVVQPFIEIAQEVHYVFIDNKFVYAFGAKSRREEPMPNDIQLYAPSEEEVEFARQFVLWNNLQHGLQRVDVVTTVEGQKSLNELEDHCPYLWLLKMPSDIQALLVESLVQSLNSWIDSE